jgi:hypothetical protein
MNECKGLTPMTPMFTDTAMARLRAYIKKTGQRLLSQTAMGQLVRRK